MPYQHESLCPRDERVQQYVDPASCTYCQLIHTVVATERSRQFRDPFTNEYEFDVEGRP